MAIKYVSQVLVALPLLLSPSFAAPASSSDCGCYSVSGPSSGRYSGYSFYDFRNINNPNGQYNSEPAVVTDLQSTGGEPVQNGYLSSDAFSSKWGIQNWGAKPTLLGLLRLQDAGTIRIQNSPQNVFIQAEANKQENATTRLTLRTTRLLTYMSTAEIDSVQDNIKYASIRVRARVRGASGACAGIFTYFNDTNESDVEILTKDSNTKVHLTNQPTLDSNGNVIPEATSEVNIQSRTWKDWNTYRIDWTPQKSAWYINGLNVVNKTWSIPKQPSHLILNMWSNGGPWSGTMPVGSNAYMDVAWIEMAYNTPSSTNSCSKVCAVDSEHNLGSPRAVTS